MIAGNGPAWVSTLIIAKEWALPPWEVVGDISPQPWTRWRWLIREREYLRQQYRREKDAQEEAERQSRGKWQKP